ncbi:hypothetical protein GQ43DRAFT_466559 [Delitschia confertaspora ATCC 74209]|uniref:Antigenic cell wall galactomannoprotein n=1 Tax=Delitschia confertaspora ATCC 74209 TaxID=1513339 RepID=A0A9P4JDI1_9PLEO|nr:hypothetical protein GQ43DRAFT_466559 [Delitschia confertaspora ATCC 74209]
MRFFKVFCTIGALLPFAMADGAAIVNAMKDIETQTIALNTTVAAFNGNPLKVVDILLKSTSLLTTIKKGTKIAKDSASLTDLEALGLAGETQSLASIVSSSLTTIVSKKKVFQKDLLQPAIYLTLKQQKEVSDKFSTVVVSKVPEALRGVAQSLVDPIDVAFDAAIAEYKKFP